MDSSSSVAYFADGRQWPFVTPMDLLRFKPLPPLARDPARRRRAGDPARPGQPGAVRARHRAQVDRALHGPRRLPRAVGPAAARQVRRARRRHRDGLAAEQVPAAARRRRRRGEARLPEALVGAAVRRAARADRGRRRARADRPPGREASSRASSITPGRARARSGAGHDPRDFETLEPERYDAVLATVPSDVFEQLAAPGAGARGLPGQAARDRVLHRALPADRARPPVLAVLLDQHRRRRAAVRRADRAHEPDRARALRRPPLPLRRQLPAARARAARARRRRRCWSATRPGCRRSTRRVRARLGQAAVAAPRAGRPADRDRRLPREDPGHADAHARPRSGQHDADLPRGPRHELRGARGQRGGRARCCWRAHLPYTKQVRFSPLEKSGRACRYWGHDLPGLELALPSSRSRTSRPAEDDLHHCAACGKDYVNPVDWEPVTPEAWWMRCAAANARSGARSR